MGRRDEDSEADSEEEEEEEDRRLYPGARKKRRRPGWWWNCWSILNNERLFVMLCYVVLGCLMLAIMTVVGLHHALTLGTDPVLYLDVINPKYTCGDMNSVQDFASESSRMNASDVGVMSLSFIAMVLAGCGFYYGLIDARGQINYSRMEPYYTGVLFGTETGLMFWLSIQSMVASTGPTLYNSECHNTTLVSSNLKVSESDLVSSIGFSQLVLQLSWAAIGAELIIILLHSSLFCSSRTWQETKGIRWNQDESRAAAEELSRI
mmetsp:Transcript_20861/g.36982  ORF Transcript_20861/g.36982 Transcript_20861/m.36982 type:complete len:264 (-) Transcript_20861:255-1046(-)